MGFWETALVAFGVSVDAAAVSTAGAVMPTSLARWRCAVRAAVFFGGFQFFMPLIGFTAAEAITVVPSAWGRYVACGLLTLVGLKMIVEAWRKPGQEGKNISDGIFTLKRMSVLAVATSLDALAVGAGLAFAGRSIWLPAAAMGVVTGAVSASAVFIGGMLSGCFGPRRAGTIGGIAIVLVGIKLLTGP